MNLNLIIIIIGDTIKLFSLISPKKKKESPKLMFVSKNKNSCLSSGILQKTPRDPTHNQIQMSTQATKSHKSK